MKVMRVGARAYTFPLLSEEYWEYTTYWWVRIYPSILQLHSPQTNKHPVHSPQRFRCHSLVHHHLVFNNSDEESPVWPSDPCIQHSSTPDSSPVCRGAEPPLPAQHHMNYHHTSPPSTDQFFKDDTTKEDFPTDPLDDDIWSDIKPQVYICASMTHLSWTTYVTTHAHMQT